MLSLQQLKRVSSYGCLKGLVSYVFTQGGEMDRRLVLSCLLGLFGSDEFERMTTPSVKVVLLLSLCSVVGYLVISSF